VAKALTHSSYALESNQKVEFLGDKVLGLALGEHLTARFPTAPVAALSELFATFSSNAHLYRVGKACGLQTYVRWRPSETESDEEPPGEEGEKPGFVKALADSVEAIIGGIYLEKGLKHACEFVFQYVVPKEQATELEPFLNHYAPKVALARFLNRSGEGFPYYRLLQDSGRQSHKATFISGVFVDNKQIGVGASSSIHRAETMAAQDALNKLWGVKSYQPLRSAQESK